MTSPVSETEMPNLVVREDIITRTIGILRAQGDDALADELAIHAHPQGKSAIATVWNYVSAVPGAVASQVNAIFGFGESEHRPQRRSDVEQWLMRMRQEYGITEDSWAAFDMTVREYRKRADKGLSLSDELPTEDDDDEEPTEIMVGVVDLTEEEIPGEGAVLIAEVRTEEKLSDAEIALADSMGEEPVSTTEIAGADAEETEAIANANEGNVPTDTDD